MSKQRKYSTYIAAGKFSLGLPGSKNEEQLSILEGDTIEYNGKTAIIFGEEYVLPRLQSAIAARWLVPEDELYSGAAFVPVSAGIHMRGATPEQQGADATTSLSEEERDMGTFAQVRARAAVAPTPVVAVSDYVIEGQDSVEVPGTVFTNRAQHENGQSVNVSTTQISSAAQELKEAERKRIHFTQLEQKRMEKKILELQKKIAASASVKTTQIREGISFETVGVSNAASQNVVMSSEAYQDLPEYYDPKGGSSVQEQAPQYAVEDIVTNKAARLELARQMFPAFEWDFSIHWRKKLAAVKENATPMFIMAVYAVESDSIKKNIAKMFPEYKLGA